MTQALNQQQSTELGMDASPDVRNKKTLSSLHALQLDHMLVSSATQACLAGALVQHYSTGSFADNGVKIDT